MPRPADLLELANALSAGDVGASGMTVDAKTLAFLFYAAAAGTAIIAAAFVAGALALARKASKAREDRRARGSRASGEATGSTGSATPVGPRATAMAEAAGPCAEIRTRLDEMIGKTNERNNYINSIFSSIEDGFMLADARNDIVLYNPRARELLGIGPEVFVDRPGKKESYPAGLATILGTCARVFGTGESGQLQLVDSRGRILDARVVPVANKYRSAERLGSLAIVRDVTEMRKMESMKKDFVATVSHEFRTPLTLICGFMEMFRTQEDIEPADRARAFEILGIETERLKRLVSELLTLSEIENSLPGNARESIVVGAAIGTVLASLESLAGNKGQSFLVNVDPRSGILMGKEDWFLQAVRNLVENAIKYTPAGGTIRLDARRESSGELLVAVSDSGIGIAESELGRIFERFYRVEKSRGSGSGGSGLGLALVKDIMAIFGGSVAVSSEPGKGSVFTLRFPPEPQSDEVPDSWPRSTQSGKAVHRPEDSR
jgi:two-component system phosphate regulon sensor histidine kinase PhoR